MREGAGGASSTMPHKRNPVDSALAIACARVAHGHAATLTGSLAQEHERAAGAWHAEWPALSGALAYAGGAVAAVARALDGLEVDVDAMRRNLELTQGAVFAEHATFLLAERLGRPEARERVERAIASGRPLREELDLPDGAFDVEAAVATAGVVVDQALERYGAVALKLRHRLEGPDGAPVSSSPTRSARRSSSGTQNVDAWTPNVRVLRYDARGHGGSDVPPGPYSLELLGARRARAARRARDRARVLLRRLARGRDRAVARGERAGADRPPRRRVQLGPLRRARPAGTSEPSSSAQRGWRRSPTPSCRAGSRRTRRASSSPPTAHARLDPARRLRRYCEAWRRGTSATASDEIRARHARDRRRRRSRRARGRLGADRGRRPGLAARRARARGAPRERRARRRVLRARRRTSDRAWRPHERRRDAHPPRGARRRARRPRDRAHDRETADFQDLITRYAWGEIWARPGLDRRTRSCITLTALVALNREHELALHIRAALRNGADERRDQGGAPPVRGVLRRARRERRVRRLPATCSRRSTSEDAGRHRRRRPGRAGARAPSRTSAGIESVVLEVAQPRVRRAAGSAPACSSRERSTC